MDRRRFLESMGFGFLGVGAASRVLTGAVGAIGTSLAAPERLRAAALDAPTCWMTPEKTEGPYYFDPNLIRTDITEGKTGVPLSLAVGVVDVNCTPVPNLLVDIWHADKDGLYSGYQQPGGSTRGQTFLRGTQATDAYGIAQFKTIYPGWYQGRATHIHFKVRIPDQTYVTSQFAFPDAVNNAVYATSLYAGRGRNPTTNASDSIFRSSDPAYLEVDVQPTAVGSYDGVFAIGLATDLAGGFHALSRTRLLDTRNRVSERGGPALVPSATRAFKAVGNAGIPAGAKAIVADVYVLRAKKAGRLQLFSADLEAGTGPNLDFRVPRTTFSGVNIPLSSEDAFAVRSTRAEPVTALADPTFLEQAVSNLVYNAICHNRPGGHAALILDLIQGDEGRFRLRVIDDGPGIPEAELARLAVRGFRGDEARTRVPGGQGLGLDIAHRVAKLHDFTLVLRRSEYGGLEAELAGPLAAALTPE